MSKKSIGILIGILGLVVPTAFFLWEQREELGIVDNSPDAYEIFDAYKKKAIMGYPDHMIIPKKIGCNRTGQNRYACSWTMHVSNGFRGNTVQNQENTFIKTTGGWIMEPTK